MTKARSLLMENPQRGLSIQPGVARHAGVQATLGIFPGSVTTLKGLDQSHARRSTDASPSGLREIWRRLPGAHACVARFRGATTGLKEGTPVVFSVSAHVAARSRFPKAIQGYSSLPKPIQGFFGKNIFLFFTEGGQLASTLAPPFWPVKPSQAPVKGSQARSSSVKQFSGKKRLFISWERAGRRGQSTQIKADASALRVFKTF
jgi:hypothetical protein